MMQKKTNMKAGTKSFRGMRKPIKTKNNSSSKVMKGAGLTGKKKQMKMTSSMKGKRITATSCSTNGIRAGKKN